MNLRPLQKRAIKWMREHPRGMIPMPVGQGKTRPSLVCIEEWGEPALVVSTKHIIEKTWRDEIRDCGFAISYAACCGPKAKRVKAIDERPMLLGVSFENLKWYFEQGHDLVERRILFIDESSKMKGLPSKSKRVRAMHARARRFDRAYLLSATPAPEGALDLWSQFGCAIHPNPLGMLGQFRSRYFDEETRFTHTEWTIKEDGLEGIAKHLRPYYMPVPPGEISDFGIPMPNEIRVAVEWGSEQEAEDYGEMANEMVLELGGWDAAIMADSPGVLQNKLRQMASGFLYKPDKTAIRMDGWHDKARATLAFMERIGDDQLLIATQFQEEIEQLRTILPDALYGVPDDLTKWSARREGQPMILHPKSAGHGLNLQKGSATLLFYSMPWGAEDYDQTVGRLHRGGQDRQVTVARFERQGTIEERMYAAILKKRADQKEIMDELQAS